MINKIGDFSFCKNAANTSIATGTSVVGTPIYMAPEMHEGKKYNIQVDMWSLGCIIFFMVFGIPPFYFDDSIGTSKFLEKLTNLCNPFSIAKIYQIYPMLSKKNIKIS